MNINIINTNIDDYTINELLDIVGLVEPTKEEIINKIEFLNSNKFKDKTKINNFLIKIRDKLLDNKIETDNRETNSILLENFANNIETDNQYTEIKSDIESDNKSDVESDNLSDAELNNETDNESDNRLDNRLDNESNNNLEYKTYDLIEKDKNVIENFYIHDFLYFNTDFREKTNYNIEFNSTANSYFTLSSPIKNVTQIKLASINLKKPFLISEYKSNNKFLIKKYILNNNVSYCDISYLVILDNGYYDTQTSIINEINNKINSSNNEFIKNIVFNINSNSQEITFDLSYDLVSNSIKDLSFYYFELDFNTYYSKYYSLAYILGFDTKTTNYSSFIDISNSNNKNITSPYIFNNNETTDLFFSFDDYQSNIIETQKLFINRALSTYKILTKINLSSATSLNNYFINEVFSITDTRYDNIRKYHGFVNLDRFFIKIIDYYGNIIDTQTKITFTLDVKIYNEKLISENNYKI